MPESSSPAFGLCSSTIVLSVLSFPPDSPYGSKTYQLPLFFIPQPQHKKTKTGKESYRLHGLEQRDLVLHGVEFVVRNARIEVMNVMKSDIAAEELQYLRKFIEGTTF